jgi:PAS domain S-box-containing protein
MQTRRELEELNRSLKQEVSRKTKRLQKSLSDLRALQKDLFARETKYRSLTENTRDILISLDGEWSIDYISPQVNRYGIDPEEMAGRRLIDFVSEDDRERVASEMERARTTGEIRTFEYRTSLTEGHNPWFEFAGTVQRDKGKNLLNVTGVLRNVTERRAAIDALKESEDRRTELSAKLVLAQNHEQQRISEILHDQVLQLVAAVRMKHGLLKKYSDVTEEENLHQEIGDLLGKIIERLRSLSFELNTSALLRMGFSEAIRELCAAMQARYGIRVVLDVAVEDVFLDVETSTVFFKGARELLFNVVKHAGVQRATLSLRRESNRLKLTVADQGCGFRISNRGSKPSFEKGLGLFNIQQWLEDIGGSMKVDSKLGAYTRIVIRVPLNKG